MPRRLEILTYRLHPRASAMPLPDFLGIGAQKAGTTWLGENLRAHPEVYLPERKELHYFDNKFERPLREYAKHFQGAVERVRGEITPAYGILPAPRIRAIRCLLPRLRLLFLMRNPIDRSWSQALMQVAARTGRTPHEVPEAEYRDFLRSEECTARSDYEAILTGWLRFYPETHLFVGFFEDLSEQPRKLLQQVFRHLGVDDEPDWSSFPVDRFVAPKVFSDRGGHELHVSPARPIVSEARPPPRLAAELRDRWEPQIRRLAKRFDAPATRWLARS